jgi:hypothetical protein
VDNYGKCELAIPGSPTDSIAAQDQSVSVLDFYLLQVWLDEHRKANAASQDRAAGMRRT